MFHFHFLSTLAANKMMMFVPRDLIDKMSVAHQCRACEPILGKKFQCPIHRGFSETVDLTARLFVYLRRCKMPAGMAKHMQNGVSLRCHTISARPQLRDKFF